MMCDNLNARTRDKTFEFIEKAKKIHGDKYDYSKVEYVNNKTKVCIICPIHGETWQTPNKHLTNKCGCYKCSVESRADKRRSYESFLQKAKQIHGDKYDYSKVNYINLKTKVCIICPKHGETWQTPQDHLNSFGCKYCGFEHRSKTKTKTTETIISQFKKIHKNKYDYSKVKYSGCFKNVCIICPIHGEFWQTPDNHLHGKGCPICSESKLEKNIRDFLSKNKITYKYQKMFKWLTNKKSMKLDFYLPKYNVAIECQGIQHFKGASNIMNGWFNGETNKNIIEENIEKIQKRDKLKHDLCNEHGIKMFYFSDIEKNLEYPYKIYRNLDLMLNDIKNNGNK